MKINMIIFLTSSKEQKEWMLCIAASACGGNRRN